MSSTRRQRLTRLQTTCETLEELEAMRLVSLWIRARYAALASELEDDDAER